MAEQDTAPAPEMKRTASSSRRLPGLEDLAARMNVTPRPADASASATSSRPRLATSLLRTTSHTSHASEAPNPSSTSGPASTVSERAPYELPAVSVSDPSGEDVPASGNKGTPAPRGYKNVPSLNEIAGRLKARESAKEKDKDEPEASGPEVEPGEVPDTVDLSELHPLRHKWTFYFDAKQPPPRPTGEATPVPYTPSNTESGEYEAGLKVVGKFKTVEDFCRLFNWVKPPSKLDRSSNYHLFKSGIKPMWEDPANANGGKWVITMRNNPVLLDRCWSWLVMGLVGQELDDRDDIICGAVVSLRSKIDRIQLWIRQKDDVERVNAVGKKLVKLLDLETEPGVQLEFQYNSDERVPPTKYISIMPPQAQFRRGPETPTSGAQDGFFPPPASGSSRGGAFGAFGAGRGAFGSSGRGSFGAAKPSTSPGTSHARTSSLSSGA